MDELESRHPARFTLDRNGKSTAVVLDVKTYITLLVWANVTDVALWPPGFQEGASALARALQIESSCEAQEDEFDWEKLPPSVQDEYDTLCVFLDSLQDDDDSGVKWEAYKAGHEEDRG